MRIISFVNNIHNYDEKFGKEILFIQRELQKAGSEIYRKNQIVGKILDRRNLRK